MSDVTPDVTPDKEPVRHEDGIPHQSHRWVTACDSERGMCADCGVDIEDDEALEPCTTTAAPDVEAAPDLARPEDLSQWLRRGALWALGYVPDEHGSEVDAASRALAADTATPGVKAALEAIMDGVPKKSRAAYFIRETLRALAAERDALRERVGDLEERYGRLEGIYHRTKERKDALAAERDALRARVAELEKAMLGVEHMVDIAHHPSDWAEYSDELKAVIAAFHDALAASEGGHDE